jgi:tRNA A-37 threonylcarbamoyl transferase component Bud32
LCNGVDGIELLKKHIDYVIFLPEGKTLVSVCDKKNNENVILVDESHSKVICAKTVLNDIACFNNTYVLTPEEYSSPYFVFDENRILSKRTKSINGNEEKILLKDVLYPSNEVGFSLCKWEIETFDYDYSRFNPYYVLDNYSLISKTEIEAKETNSKCVLLLDLITKQKFQPKIFYYDKFEHSLSMDESAYHIKEGIVDFGYLINEMNKKYFIDQIFPTDVKVDAALEWSDLGQCYIKFPDTHNTATPIERQKILLNEEKMEFINKILRNYDYDVEKIIKGNKANLKKNTILNGHYRIVGFLGSGGFGKTYKAIRTNEDNSETIVAIKEFFDCVYQKRAKDSNEVVNLSNDIKNIVEVRNKFFTEAKKIQKFAHCENIVKVHEVFDENNTSYYSMEYIDGYNLLDYVKEKGKLLEKEAIRIIRGVANALKAMHNESMLHMDVKPGNIMIGKNGRVVLIDFGGAHKYNASFQKNTTLVNLNSPGFTPPELIGSYRFSPAYDIYSLGATLHFMLLGDIPNNGSGESRISTNINNSSMLNELPNDISEKTKECIGKSMNSSPNYRPQTIDEFLAMLPGE